jgi:hypothetical protein
MSDLAHSQMAKNRVTQIDNEILYIFQRLKEIYKRGKEPRHEILELHKKIDSLMDDREILMKMI